MTPQNLAYAAYIVAALILAVATIRIIARGRKVKVLDSAILLFVLVGLVYDNFMLAFGGMIFDEGELFLGLSVPRYLMHGLFTPLLIMQAALSADRLNVPGYRSRELLTLWGGTTFLAIFLGLSAEIELPLGYDTGGGAIAYRLTKEAGPPLAEIITVFSMMVIGVAMARYVRLWWMLVCSSTMLLFALFWIDNGVIANLGEIILLTGCVVTGWYAVKAAEAERDDKRRQALDRKQRKDEQPAPIG
jgi:hypothetical protein